MFSAVRNNRDGNGEIGYLIGLSTLDKLRKNRSAN